MKLTINGNEAEYNDSLTVSELLEVLDIEPARVAAEVNINIIKKANYQEHVLNDGDSVEIVNFVGGG
jgi:sulfur carrier protein